MIGCETTASGLPAFSNNLALVGPCKDTTAVIQKVYISWPKKQCYSAKKHAASSVPIVRGLS